jgi:hypothetical protein
LPHIRHRHRALPIERTRSAQKHSVTLKKIFFIKNLDKFLFDLFIKGGGESKEGIA